MGTQRSIVPWLPYLMTHLILFLLSKSSLHNIKLFINFKKGTTQNNLLNYKLVHL